MKNNTLTPQIRFKGFEEEWKKATLSTCGLFNPNCALPLTFNYVDLESVVGTQMVRYRVENKYTAPSRAQRVAQKGDVFYQTVRPYQKNNYLYELDESNFVFSTGYAQIRPYINGRFLFSSIQRDSFVSQVLLNCTGTSYPAINTNILSQLIIVKPIALSEQSAIGEYFRMVDELIAEAQREVSRLEKMKQASLQKMFPRPGESVPEVRFAGFTEDWKTVRLGDYASFSRGQGYTKNDLQESGTPIFLYGRLYTKYSTYVESVDTFSHITPSSVMSRGKEIVMPSSGETAEDIAVASAILSKGIILGGGLNIIIPKDGVDSIFLALSLTYGSAHKELAKKAQGKSVVHIYNQDIADLSVSFPESLAEQAAIGEYFRNLDSLIDARRRRVAKLRDIKKACLDKMFAAPAP